MDMYREVPAELMEVAEEYSLKGELPKISGSMIFNGKKYYEIIYVKKRLGKLDKEAQGRLVIDDQGKAVTDKGLLKDLIRLFYYYSNLSGSILTDLKSAAKTESQSMKDGEDYEEASQLLQSLADDEVAGASAVKNITEKLPEMRREASDVLKQTIESIEKFTEDNTMFTESELTEILSLYEKTHIMSFERVKLINTASGYLSNVKREVVSRRRKLKYGIDKRNMGPLLRLESILEFFTGILKYYGEVINYSIDRYKKLLEKNDNLNIEKCYAQIREKRENLLKSK